MASEVIIWFWQESCCNKSQNFDRGNFQNTLVSSKIKWCRKTDQPPPPRLSYFLPPWFFIFDITTQDIFQYFLTATYINRIFLQSYFYFLVVKIEIVIVTFFKKCVVRTSRLFFKSIIVTIYKLKYLGDYAQKFCNKNNSFFVVFAFSK